MIEVELIPGAGRGAFVLGAAGSGGHPTDTLASIMVTRPGSPGRREAEELIESVYLQKYGARIASHYPTLLCACAGDGRVLASIGFRAAAEQPLFLEHYLDQPIEDALGDAGCSASGRAGIVEIGNLAACNPGASLFLFVTLAALLRYRGYVHAVATATRALKRTIESFGFKLASLGPADPDRLADRGESWGRYYASQPMIVAGDIGQCFERLAHFLPPDRHPDLAALLAGHGELAFEGQA